MTRKSNKIKASEARKRCPPKAKVVRSNRAGCTTLPLPKKNQVVEIPQGYEVLERIVCEDFVHKRTLFIRQTDPILFDIHLKSRRAVNMRPRTA